MKIYQLLHQRDAVLRQARLANIAFAYHELGLFVARIARGRLRGEVTLQAADRDADRPWPVLVANEGNQSVIEEHFTDGDIVELADLLVFLSGGKSGTDFTFRLEDMDNQFRSGLRRELEAAGVALESGEAKLDQGGWGPSPRAH